MDEVLNLGEKLSSTVNKKRNAESCRLAMRSESGSIGRNRRNAKDMHFSRCQKYFLCDKHHNSNLITVD